jgi:4-hydroxyphenylpyruvate dioxygenase-like putative hemolysin
MIALDNIEYIHNTAAAAAQKATAEFLAKHGDCGACGFAWVVVRAKGSTKLGRALKAVGFRKEHGGGLSIWNPSGSGTQSIDAKEDGAIAYAKVMAQFGIEAYAASRLD